MRTPGYNKALHRFAVFLAAMTTVLLTAGALVTSNDAGLSIPDWPLAYNSMVPPLVGGIRFEWTHRVIAGTVGLLTALLVGWLSRRESRPRVRMLGWIAAGSIVCQIILGGMTVRMRQPIPVSAAHACLAQIFFCIIVSIALFTSRWWWAQNDQQVVEDTGTPQVRTLASLTVVATFMQLVLGAVYRHKGSGIFPDLVGAAVVTAMIFFTAGAMRNRFPSSAPLTRCRRLLHSMIGLQLILGGAAWWSRVTTAEFPQPMPVMITFTVMHVVTGALTLAATVVTALVSYRLLSAPERMHVGSRAAQGVTAQ